MPNEIPKFDDWVKTAKPRRYDEDSALDLIAQHESGGRNIKQQIVPAGGGYNPSVGRVTGPSTASGPWQITNSTWRKRAPRDVATKYPNAMSAPVEVQRAVAGKMYRETGFQDWEPYNATLRRAIARGEQPRSKVPAEIPKFDDWSEQQSTSIPKFDEWQAAPRATPTPQQPTAEQALRKVMSDTNRIMRSVPKPKLQPRQPLEVGAKVGGPQASQGIGDLRRLDDPETSRINRIQQQVTAAQTPAERQMGRAPDTQDTRLLAPKLTENEEVLRRVGEEQGTEQAQADAQAERQRLQASFTPEDKQQMQDIADQLRGRGPGVKRGMDAALQQRVASFLYKLGGVASLGSSALADNLRRKALAGELAVEDIQSLPKPAREQVAQFLTESAAGLAEIAVTPGGPVTKFAGLAAAEALGRNRPTSEVLREAGKGAAIGQVFKSAEGLAPQGISLARRIGRVAPAIGAGTAAVELSTGATPREAGVAALSNTAFGAMGELGRGRNAIQESSTKGVPVREASRDSAEVVKGVPEPREVADAQAVTKGAEVEVKAPHHSAEQLRRARNTATGTKGQFKKGKVEQNLEAGLVETPAVEPTNAPTETAAREVVPETASTPEVKTSRLAQGVEAKAVEAKLTEGFKDLPEYETVKVADQADRATRLLQSDPEKATRIAMGKEVPPADLLPESVFVAVENQALKNGDVELLRNLATASSLPTEATGMGQRIRMLAERNPNSAVSAMRDVQLARQARAEKTYGKQAKNKIKTEINVELQKALPKAKDWHGFLDEIRCK